jgi:hypothetical protein
MLMHETTGGSNSMAYFVKLAGDLMYKVEVKMVG